MKNLKSIAGAVAFMVLWAGAAIAMPTSFFADDELLPPVEDVVVEDEQGVVGIEEGETEEVDDEEEDGIEEEDGDVGATERPDNHGKAVSTAAHCDLKGRAKGALVSSVARDQGATVESAQAACDAAVAAAGASSTGKPAKSAKPEKPEKPEKASVKPDRGAQGKATKPSGTETATTDESSSEVEETPEESGPPADAGPPADKGGSKKP